MSDPRNVAHDKKVTQEKEHHPESGSDSKAKKGRRKKKTAGSDQNDAAEKTAGPAESAVQQVPGDLEKSVAVLSKLKDMEFHSRANIETLAGLILTIEDELKQKEFSDPIGELYAAQDAFHAKIAALIETYEVKCESLKPSA